MTKTILFDLDGTLLDSAKDLHTCLNTILVRHGKAPVNLDMIQQHINVGAQGFIQLGFQEDLDDKKLTQLREEFLAHYTDMTLHVPAHFFEGTIDLLNALTKNNITWGIVTNKHERFTIPILKNLELLEQSKTIICGNTVSKGKPSPVPLFMACNELKIEPQDACYVGDSLADMQAAKNAGMPGYLVLWGYWQHLKYSTEGWPYTSLLERPQDLLSRHCEER